MIITFYKTVRTLLWVFCLFVCFFAPLGSSRRVLSTSTFFFSAAGVLTVVSPVVQLVRVVWCSIIPCYPSSSRANPMLPAQPSPAQPSPAQRISTPRHATSHVTCAQMSRVRTGVRYIYIRTLCSIHALYIYNIYIYTHVYS